MAKKKTRIVKKKVRKKVIRRQVPVKKTAARKSPAKKKTPARKSASKKKSAGRSKRKPRTPKAPRTREAGDGGVGDGGGGSADVVHIDDMYGDWFIDYASYVILERAVPHIADGLKPGDVAKPFFSQGRGYVIVKLLEREKATGFSGMQERIRTDAAEYEYQLWRRKATRAALKNEELLGR